MSLTSKFVLLSDQVPMLENLFTLCVMRGFFLMLEMSLKMGDITQLFEECLSTMCGSLSCPAIA